MAHQGISTANMAANHYSFRLPLPAPQRGKMALIKMKRVQTTLSTANAANRVTGQGAETESKLRGACWVASAYLSTVTLPLRTGRKKTGSETRMGLNWNLQPKQSAESLKKDTDTIGLSKMWMGSTWETMQPPGW